jgi:hypothetical protein
MRSRVVAGDNNNKAQTKASLIPLFLQESQPSLPLLRMTILKTSFPERSFCLLPDTEAGLDQKQLLLVYNENAVSSDHSYAATLLLDASIHLPPGASSFPYSRLVSVWKDIMSPMHFPSFLDNDMFRIAWCGEMEQKNKFLYLMSKMVVQRCMTRKFNTVSLRIFKDSNSTSILFQKILLLSLLGNYTFIQPSSRPDVPERIFLYQNLSSESNDWFLTLVEHCPYLIEFAAREFMVYHMHDTLGIRKHLQLFLSVELFQTIVVKSMNMARRRVSLHLKLRSSPMTLCQDLSQALEPYHKALSGLCYRIPLPLHDVLSALTSVREFELPLQKFQEAEAARETDDDKDDEEEELNAMMEKLMDIPSSKVDDDDEEEEQEEIIDEEEEEEEQNDKKKKNKKKKKPRKAKDAAATEAFDAYASAEMHLGPTRLRRLETWVRCGAPSRRDALPYILSLFPLLGASRAATKQLLNCIHEFTIGCLDRDHFPASLKAVQHTDALTYTLLQVTVDLFKICTRLTLVRTLPQHIVQAQLHACIRGTTGDSQCVLYDTAEFVWCPICDQVCSMIRGEQTIATTAVGAGGSKKKIYQYGLRNIVVDYDTDIIYCRNDKRNVLGKCGEEPLLRFPMFGLLLQHGDNHIMLCTQCAAPMRLDTLKVAFPSNGDGPVCSKCVLQQSKQQQVAVVVSETTVEVPKVNKKCHYCGCDLTNPVYTFYYGPDLYLCSKHHRVVKYRTHGLDAIRDMDQNATKEERAKKLADVHRKSKADYQARQLARQTKNILRRK